MKTAQEAKQAMVEVIHKYGYTGNFVVVEHKLTRNAKKTFFGFRKMIDESFSTEWLPTEGGSFSRMVEMI